LFVSTTTITGQDLAKQKLGEAAHVFYFPFDWNFSVRNALSRVRPALVVIAETEIWPNFLRQCNRRQIPILLVNGRISDNSIRQYQRIRWLMRKILPQFSACCMQTATDLDRILALGARPETAEVCGNLKYDINPPADFETKLASFRPLVGWDAGIVPYIFVAGSTMKGEEEMVLAAFQQLCQRVPHSLMFLAPRHRERFQQVADLLQVKQVPFLRRSGIGLAATTIPASLPKVILLDSLGELGSLYALADVVFVGGSLIPKGGHNILEPAVFKKPVLFGPHMNNFREMAELFVRQQAGFMVSDSASLAQRLIELHGDSRLRNVTGERGAQILATNRGATERIMECVKKHLA
jgi:3-deoxy-D-manno-octulosonic-acid transferase